MRRAPASSAFSSSSFTTDAGRSTTSPAAILLATCSGSTWMRPMGLVQLLVGSSQLLVKSSLSALQTHTVIPSAVEGSCLGIVLIQRTLLFRLLLLQLGLKCFFIVIDKRFVSGRIDEGVCLACLLHLLALAKHVEEAGVRAEEDIRMQRLQLLISAFVVLGYLRILRIVHQLVSAGHADAAHEHRRVLRAVFNHLGRPGGASFGVSGREMRLYRGAAHAQDLVVLHRSVGDHSRKQKPIAESEIALAS